MFPARRPGVLIADDLTEAEALRLMEVAHRSNRMDLVAGAVPVLFWCL
jgi:hypothetical protein